MSVLQVAGYRGALNGSGTNLLKTVTDCKLYWNQSIEPEELAFAHTTKKYL